MSPCVCKILFKSEQICSCFWDIWYNHMIINCNVLSENTVAHAILKKYILMSLHLGLSCFAVRQHMNMTAFSLFHCSASRVTKSMQSPTVQLQCPSFSVCVKYAKNHIVCRIYTSQNVTPANSNSDIVIEAYN